ncbi:hypothetical protein FIU89_07740 [Roseovarius sp. THAF27]|nr:hypothetical protein FIU89_07740 [Roseovarius sp. THAF27]
MAFIVGGLVVAVGVIAWVMFGDSGGGGDDLIGGSEPSDVNVSVETSDDAADDVADAAEDTADAVEGAADDVEGAAQDVEDAADNVEGETQQ